MTANEFSNAFDTLLNSHSIRNEFGDTGSLASIELDEYEKSMLLTKAQEELIKSIYGESDTNEITFESTEQARRSMNQLVVEYSTTTQITNLNHSYPNSSFFKIPNECWFIVYESVIFKSENNPNTVTVVKPLLHDDLNNIMNNPFKKPTKKRVFRLDISDNTVEIVSGLDVLMYKIRYVRQPKPIILTNLVGVNINGISDKTECELNSLVHNDILNIAVRMCLERISAKQNK